jgi:hypothetical protein
VRPRAFEFYPVVQAAIDSGADTVLIRAGTYPDRPVVDHDLVLLGIGPGARPRLAGLDIVNTNFKFSSPHSLRVSQLAFSDRVEFRQLFGDPNLLAIDFSECTLDAGFQENGSGDPPGIGSLAFRNCRLGGPNAGAAEGIVMQADTVSSVSWYAHGIVIRDCWFTGGPGTAMELFSVLDITVVNNRVDHYYDGIKFRAENDNATVEGNTITGCPGTAIEIPEVGNVALLRNNEIEDCGIGIHAMSMISEARIVENRVLRTAGSGIWAYPSSRVVVERNVVGNCGGAGIRVERDPWGSGSILGNNTVFGNAGSGIEVISPQSYSTVRVEGNIGFGNGGWGLTVPGGVSVQPGCNDWFGNTQGAVQGIPAGATDLSVDPLFCNVEHEDVSLDSASPLLDAAGCGQIGALGEGCNANLPVSDAAEPLHSRSRVFPNPAFGPATIEWTLEAAADMDVRVYDLAGREVAAPVRGRFGAGRNSTRWDGLRSGGEPASSGWYVVKVRGGALSATHRLLLLR